MDATDLHDVTGATYTFMMNGLSPAQHWAGLCKPGERVWLRIINASSTTFYDVRLPGYLLRTGRRFVPSSRQPSSHPLHSVPISPSSNQNHTPSSCT